MYLELATCRARVLLLLAASVVGSAAATGCARVHVRLNAYSSTDLPFPEPSPDHSVCVVTESDTAEPLLEAEVTAKIERLLQDLGYALAPEDQADYLLSCWLSMDAGELRTTSVPVHEPDRYVHSYYYGRHGVYAVKTTRIPGRTHYVPQSYTVFSRFLGLKLYQRELFDQVKEADPAQALVWQCVAISRGQSTDLRWLVNHLLIAAFDYFGQDTGKQVRVSLAWKDERAKELARATRAAPTRTPPPARKRG